jgi:hypothetical protein
MEEKLNLLIKKMIYIFQSKYKYENTDWKYKLSKQQYYLTNKAKSAYFELTFTKNGLDADMFDEMDEVKNIANNCFEIFSGFYITDDLKLAENSEIGDDLIAYLIELNINNVNDSAMFKLAFDYNFYTN